MPGSFNPYYSITCIQSYQNAKEKSSATGFFFSKDRQSIFLVTCKHVLYGNDYKLPTATPIITKLRLYLHTTFKLPHFNEYVTIELFDNGVPKWFEHPRPEVDVVAIPVQFEKKYAIDPIDCSYLDSGGHDAFLNRILVVGYPYEWFDRFNNFPVIRVGFLSSPYRVGFGTEQYMIGDVQTHPGMSGGPVFLDLTANAIQNKAGEPEKKILFIGVNSGQIQFPKKPNERPDLIVIWFASHVLQIIEANQKK